MTTNHQGHPMSALLIDFRDQSPMCAGLTDEQIEPYVEHHSGGLVVLASQLGDDETGLHYVKMHDSWGDDGKIVVHRYDVEGEQNDPIADQVTYHDNFDEAYRVFKAWVLNRKAQSILDDLSDRASSMGKVVTVLHTFRVSPGLSDDDIDTIVSHMTVQVEEPVVGHTDDLSLNEITCDTSHITVHWSAQDITKEVSA